MKTISCARVCLTAVLLSAGAVSAANWPAWRGPNQDNISPEKVAPVEWDKEKNIRWRVELPAPGNSSPVVWGDKVFVTQAIEAEGKRTVMCFDRRTGKLLWQKGTVYNEKEERHETNTHCSASPVTDGERVIAHFGSAGVYCYDFAGKELWHVDLGKQEHGWGQGSSPVISGNLCLLYHGPGKPSTLLALEKKTGKKVWDVTLPEEQPKERFDGFAGKSDGRMGSFATPLVVKSNGRDELIMPLANQLRAFDVKTGKALWQSEGMNPLIYGSPTYGENLVIVMGGFFGATIATKPGGAGNVTSQRLWYEQRAKKHRIASPVIKDGHIYVANTDGTAECLELATGKSLWMERLKGPGANGETWGSMVLIGDKLYTVNKSGDTFVLRASPRFEQIAVNSVGEVSTSTLAVSNGELFLRTHNALWCISGNRQTASAR
jgi:outer membrane protein assembly factor BamB